MDQCARCGHTLGVGRYCVNCGQPRDEGVDDWRTGTAERPAVRPAPTDPPPTPPPAPPSSAPPPPVAPPPVWETPPQVRYPLYADEPTESPEPAEPPTLWEAAAAHQDQAPPRRRSALPWLPWVLVAAALVLVAVAGVRLLTGGADDEAAEDPGPTTSTSADSPRATASRAPTPSPPTPTPTPTAPPADPQDVAGAATASAPVTAPPGRDVDGKAVRYDAANFFDGRDDTAWRAPGDATGATLGFRLDGPTRLTSVGLLNGYAKSDPGYDGYTANRRVLSVEWVFDDGTVVVQDLASSRSVQTIDVDVVTETVRLRLTSVSSPARGPAGRDYTAVSTVRLLGVPARPTR